MNANAMPSPPAATRLFEKPARLVWAGVLALGVVYLGLLFAAAQTRRPWYDEAMFANPAWNLAERGFLGTTVMENARILPNLDRYTYWIFPLNLVTLAAWFKLAGFSLLSMRVLSMLWTLVLVGEVYDLLRRWSQSRVVGALAALLTAFDYNILSAGSFGRYEPMVAALGFGGYCCYLGLRDKRLGLAVLASNACIAAAGMTHPNGLLHFCGLALLTLYYDRQRLRWRHLAIAAVPYLAGAAAWGAYILQDPRSFYLQLRMHSYQRISLFAPWQAIQGEIGRYAQAAGLTGRHSAGHSGPIALKALILAAYAAALGAMVAIGSLRRDPGLRALLWLTAVHFAYQCFVDGIKFPYYLVLIVPCYAAMLAVVAHHFWTRRRSVRPLAAAAIFGVIALSAGGLLLRIRLNTYGTMYLPAVEYLRRHATASDLIMASSDLGFAYGFRPNLLDDIRLGYYSGKVPKFIVVEEAYQYNFEAWRQSDPALYGFIRRRLEGEYQVVCDWQGYRIYRRREGAGVSSHST